MPQSLAQTYVHLIFSTKDRAPNIADAWRAQLHAYIAEIAIAHQSPIVQIGSVTDHIHILLSQSKNIALCDLMEEIKKRSSKWVNTKGYCETGFYWQRGYGAFSVSASRVASVEQYILRQPEHHKSVSFQDEFREFLKKYRIAFDEKYVWD